jgi:bestrophin-3
LEEEEKKEFEKMSSKLSKVYWMPLVWASSIVVEARMEKYIESDVGMKGCLDHLLDVRRKLDRSLQIEVINVPLVYSQVRADRHLKM